MTPKLKPESPCTSKCPCSGPFHHHKTKPREVFSTPTKQMEKSGQCFVGCKSPLLCEELLMTISPHLRLHPSEGLWLPRGKLVTWRTQFCWSRVSGLCRGCLGHWPGSLGREAGLYPPYLTGNEQVGKYPLGSMPPAIFRLDHGSTLYQWQWTIPTYHLEVLEETVQ